MATQDMQLKRRLGRVRLRWRLATAFRGLLLVVTEALGLCLLFLLADWMYEFSGQTRLTLLAVGATILGVLALRHIGYPFFRRISDDQIALYIEERSNQAEGAVISAVEFSRERRGGLYDYIAHFLVDDAVRRIDRTSLRTLGNLRRLKKHVLAAAALLAVFAVTSVILPAFRARMTRILAPQVSIRAERQAAQQREDARLAEELRISAPIAFEVQPKNTRILRGQGVPVVARLSREPAQTPQLQFRAKGGGEWQALPMVATETLHNGFRVDLDTVNEDLEYCVAVGRQRSQAYAIEVYDPLGLRGIELTFRYPAYLESAPLVTFGPSGDISAPAGTKVDVRVVANNQLAACKLLLEGDKSLDLAVGAKAEDGAKTTISVDKDSTYKIELADVYGGKLKTEQFYFIKAVPDQPPTIEMVSPKVDMSVHPLCEVTFKAKLTDDYGIKEAVVKAEHYRGEQKTELSWPMKLSDAAGLAKNVKDGFGEYVLELEKHLPVIKPGDMLFYHIQASDRKGQGVKTDVFYVKAWPLEVSATWPDSVASPDLPHETFNDPMDLMLFLAAAWHLEQQRGSIPEGEFNTQSEKIAKRMEVGDPPDFSTFWGHGGAPQSSDPQAPAILEAATRKIESAHGLLKVKHEPGKAADDMRVALAMVETLAGMKNLARLELNPEPLHTGQPSSGHADDPVLEQVAFHPPSVMTDSLTAYQQPDNPPRLLPPDYRRALAVKERSGARQKQLRVAGEIYATEEQLIEMAREQLGHIQLREAIDDNTPNDPSVSGGGGGEEARVDKRAIPYKELVSADERRGDVAMAEKQTLSNPKVDRTKSGLAADKLKDNKRRGGANPYVSQAAGNPSGADPEDPEPADPNDPTKPRKKPKQPAQSTGGGGGGEDDPGEMKGTPPPGEQQQNPAGQQSPGKRSQEMAQRQQGAAEAARGLASEIAKGLAKDDHMGQKAVEALREASAQMQASAENFQKGNIRAGVAQAQRAQQAMKTAQHGLTASQFDSLETALAAAQDGAAALAANQRRLSAGTEQMGRKVREAAGEAPGQPVASGTGGQPSQSTTGGKPSVGGAGEAPNREAAPDKAAVDKALARDPRLGPQMKGLAQEQGKLAEELSAYAGYVEDLKKWATDASKERVASSLGGVTGELRKDGTAQKMVDAAVSLAGRDLKGAQASQREVEEALSRMTSGIQEANEMLAGSPTGVLRRAAADAKDVGQRVAAMTGTQPAGGQAGPQTPGAEQQANAAQPGKAQPGATTGPADPGKPSDPTAKVDPGKQPSTQPGKREPGTRPAGDDLASTLAGDQQPGSPSGKPQKGQPNSTGGASMSNEDIDEVWLKTRRLAGTLQREQLADEQTIQFIERRSATVDDFRRMFEKAGKAEAQKFSDVVLNVGQNLEAALKDALASKKLRSEEKEECPAKYRGLVNSYFEALSKAAGARS